MELKVAKFYQNQINKIPGRFKELGEKLTKAIAQGYQDLSKFAQKKFDDVVKTGQRLKGMYDNALKSTGNFFKKMAKRLCKRRSGEEDSRTCTKIF